MKKILLISFLFISFSTLSQALLMPNAEDFVLPLNTGANMTLGLYSSDFDPYVGGIFGAFSDLNGDGSLEAIGFYEITTGYNGVALWADDSSTSIKDGLDSGEIPNFFILLGDEIYYVDLVPVNIQVLDLFYLNLLVFTLCVISIFLPSILVTKIRPIKTLKFE